MSKKKTFNPKTVAADFVRARLTEAVTRVPSTGSRNWQLERYLYLNGKDKGRYTPAQIEAVNAEILALNEALVEFTYSGYNTTPALDEATIKRLLESAIESGSSYWASELNPLGKYDKRRDLVTQCLERGFYVIDAEAGGTRYEVTPEDIKRACVLLRDFKDYEGEPMRRHYFNAVDGNDDAETGDIFLQLCVFKECIYG